MGDQTKTTAEAWEDFRAELHKAVHPPLLTLNEWLKAHPRIAFALPFAYAILLALVTVLALGL